MLSLTSGVCLWFPCASRDRVFRSLASPGSEMLQKTVQARLLAECFLKMLQGIPHAAFCRFLPATEHGTDFVKCQIPVFPEEEHVPLLLRERPHRRRDPFPEFRHCHFGLGGGGGGGNAIHEVALLAWGAFQILDAQDAVAPPLAEGVEAPVAGDLVKPGPEPRPTVKACRVRRDARPDALIHILRFVGIVQEPEDKPVDPSPHPFDQQGERFVGTADIPPEQLLGGQVVEGEFDRPGFNLFVSVTQGRTPLQGWTLPRRVGGWEFP